MTQLGFDVIIEPRIGVALYVIINVFFSFEFTFEFRITAPEMNLAICGGSGDACSFDYLRASFTIEAYLNLYIGIGLDVGNIGSMLKSLFSGKNNPSGGDSKELAFQKKIGTFTIMEKRGLGCMELKGFLLPLNTFFKGRCCHGGSAKAKYLQGSMIGYYDNDEDDDDDFYKQIGEYYGENYDFYHDLIQRKNRLKMKLLNINY